MKNIVGFKELLDRKECVLWKSSQEEWATENSSVASTPIVSLREIYNDISSVNVAVSIVRVRPKVGGPLHYHNSHILGLAINGECSFRYMRNRLEVKERVKEGDIVLVPADAYHVFEGGPGDRFSYVALEFSEYEIDYQQHRLY